MLVQEVPIEVFHLEVLLPIVILNLILKVIASERIFHSSSMNTDKFALTCLDTAMRMIAPRKTHYRKKVLGSWQCRCLIQSSIIRSSCVT